MRRVIDAGRPVAHVAEEMGISRQAADKWVRRFKADPINGLLDRDSRPKSSPKASPDELVNIVLRVRMEKRWGAAKAAAFLQGQGYDVSAVTCHRIWDRHGLSRLTDFLPDGTPAREPRAKPHTVDIKAPGNIVHIDVKKVGKIPFGGGWWAHGRGSEGHLVSKRKANHRPGKTCIHAAVDAHSRLAYIEQHDDEKAPTVVEFWLRAVEFFAAHGITIKQVTSDNGPAYKSRLFAAAVAQTETRHHRTDAYSPKQNGKVEAFNKLMKREVLQARAYESEEERRAALVEWVNDYNHIRPHGSLKQKPPITRCPTDGGGVFVTLQVEPVTVRGPSEHQLTIFGEAA